MSEDIIKRLRVPPFGTETSERHLMSAAADEIERLRARVETGSIISKRSYGAFAKALGRKINDAG